MNALVFQGRRLEGGKRMEGDTYGDGFRSI
jgi:hypothetical protein